MVLRKVLLVLLVLLVPVLYIFGKKIRRNTLGREFIGFIFEVSGWLEHLSGYMLTVASLEDHRFLMHTLLRSGRGMCEALVYVDTAPPLDCAMGGKVSA